MKKLLLASALALAFSFGVLAQTPPAAAPEETKSLGTVTVTSGRPTSLPSQIPATMEGIKAADIAQNINATDSEDALKYLPSLLIRKRYMGDYNHAVLASRASGTNNSARSAVYADGILLSNYLGNGATYAPRWGMVTPEEIDRVDVLYGPFSAAYPGNSVGAIVDYQTKMPTQYEAHAKVGAATSPFNLYGTDTNTSGKQASASVGNKNGDLAWWMDFSHQNSLSQPLVFVAKTPCTSSCGGATAVSGAVPALSPTGTPQMLFGTTTNYNTTQDHGKVKLAYDFSGTLKAAYTVGLWQNQSEGRSQSYITNSATGAPVYGGNVSVGGTVYALGTNPFSMSNEALRHMMQALSLKSNTQGRFDYEVALSQYRYLQDDNRSPSSTGTYASSIANGAGQIINQAGTGWTAFAAKGTYRPDGIKGVHIVDFGYQRDAYKLSILTDNTAAWTSSNAGSSVSDVGGNAQLQSLWGQDTWRIAKDWKTVLGLRAENWTTSNGHSITPTLATPYGVRNENALSPKAALSFQAKPDVVLKASIGRAVRFPTVQELYGSTTNSGAGTQYVNDPNLAPEKSITSEWSMEKDLAYQNGGSALLRATAFFEDTRNSLYSQTSLNTTTGLNVSHVSNIGRIKTSGLELSYQGVDIMKRGLDLSGSVTYTESKIIENTGYVTTPGDTIGSYQPRVPLFRATGLVGYRWSEKLTTSLGARFSGVQYTTLNNSDVNGYAYTAASRFFVVDTRLRYQISKSAGEETSVAVGIDNLNNYTYWNYHPYPQRTLHAELRVDWK